jgi:hypothetical protein
VDFSTERVTVNLSPYFSSTLLFDDWKIFWGKNTMTDSKASLRKKDERKRKDAQRKRDERSGGQSKKSTEIESFKSKEGAVRGEKKNAMQMREYNWALFPDEGRVASLPSMMRLSD